MLDRIQTRLPLFISVILLGGLGVTVSLTNAFLYQGFETQINRAVEEKITANRITIESMIHRMEQKASEIARLGESLYLTSRPRPPVQSDQLVAQRLTAGLSDFPLAIGLGFWFEPAVWSRDREHFGPYVFWDKGKVAFTWDLNTKEYDYHTQSWYLEALPADLTRDSIPGKRFVWTAPYVDTAGSNALMTTVDTYMVSPEGRVLGISTVDWALDDIIRILSENVPLPHAQSFLYDQKSGFILTDTAHKENRMKSTSVWSWFPEVGPLVADMVKKVDELTVDGVDYRLWATKISNGFVYISMIPMEELMQPATDVFVSNLGLSGVLALLLILSLLLALRRSFRPVDHMVSAIREVAETKNLTLLLPVKKLDELGLLAQAMNGFLDGTKSTFREVQDIAGRTETLLFQLNSHSKNVTNITDSMGQSLGQTREQVFSLEGEAKSSGGAALEIQQLGDQVKVLNSTQSGELERFNHAVQSLQNQTTRLQDRTKTQHIQLKSLSESARLGEEDMRQAVRSVEDISKSAEAIKGLIGVINDVASQTNLLAMNASIEAAHAGQYGKGFAVVAGEIRKLAETTATNVKNITSSLATISQQIEDSTEINRKTGDRIGEVVRGTLETAEGISELLEGLQTIGEFARGTEATVIQIKTGSVELEKIAGTLGTRARSIGSSLELVRTISEQAAQKLKETDDLARQIGEDTGKLELSTGETAGALKELRGRLDQFKV